MTYEGPERRLEENENKRVLFDVYSQLIHNCRIRGALIAAGICDPEDYVDG